MTEKVSRRSFFKLIGGAVALTVAPARAIAKIIEVPVEFGWTWYLDKSKFDSGFADMITSTLRQNTQVIAENISANNPLYLRLKDKQKIKLNIEKISEREQNTRIMERMQTRLRLKEARRIADLAAQGDIRKTDLEKIKYKSELALANKPLSECERVKITGPDVITYYDDKNKPLYSVRSYYCEKHKKILTEQIPCN